MLKNTIWFALSTALLATTAFAQGEGEGEAGEGEGEVAEPCGDVTPEGECDGTDAIFCGEGDQLVRLTCGAFVVGAETLVAACEVYPGFGSWCAFEDGDPCSFTTANGAINFACESNNSGCFAGVCTPNTGSCTPAAEGDPAECIDSVEATCAPWAQYVQDNPSVACSSEGEGEASDGEGEGNGNGNGNGGGGDDPPEDDAPKCNGSHPARGTPAAFAATAVAMAVVVRRRRR